MPDALNIQSSTPVGRGMAAGPESAVAAAVRGAERRISASSFKLLTAKLKNGALAGAGTAAAASESALQIVIPDFISAAGPAPFSTLPASAIGIVLPEFIPHLPPTAAAVKEIGIAAIPAMELAAVVETATVSATPAFESEAGLNLPAFVPLPQFRPVEWPSHAAVSEHEPTGIPEEQDESIVTATVAEEPQPETEVTSEIDSPPEPMAAIERDAVAEPVEIAGPTEATAAVDAAELPEVIEATAVNEATEVIEATAVIEATEVMAAVDAAGLLDAGEPPEAVEDIAGIERDALIEAEPTSGLADEHPVQIEVQPNSIDIFTEVSAVAGPDVEQAEEAKPATSDMAGRVVDAMIKTISTAIYAKPTAAERAAFLRDVATLAKEAGEAGEPLAPIYVEASDHVATSAAMPAPIIIVTPSAPGHTGTSVTDVIAERLGPAPLLKASTAAGHNDPFAQTSLPSRLADPKPAETMDADEESGDLARTLLDMMSGGTGSLPHERTLAADTLLRILPRIPVKQLMSVVERVAIMETPPALLVAKLIRDTRPEVVGPLLERCSQITDQDLMNAAPDGDTAKLRMVARRRVMSTVLSDFLIGIGDPGVLLTMIRNPGAALSHEAFFKLADYATRHHALLAPLATRADLPPPVAFELFWHVPQELRRFIFSRFLTDSETLNKILRITLATHGNDGGDAMGEGKFPAREILENAIGLAATFKRDEAALAFAEMGGIAPETASRILADQEGEPLTVLLKALGLSRAGFEEAISRLRLGESGLLRPDRNPDELQAIFEGLSFNKARILLTYWDWYMRKAGPYAPHN